MQQISATDLQSRINEPEFSALLLDVREPHEFEYCHISGSTLIPMQTIPNRVNDLPKDQTIITICHHGMRSQQVAQFLEQNGFTDIFNLQGGVHAWASEVDNAMPTY